MVEKIWVKKRFWSKILFRFTIFGQKKFWPAQMVMSWLNQCWLDQSWIDQSWLALHTQSRHHLDISRHPADTIQQPSWYNSDTLQTPSRHPQDTLRTNFKHPPNFKHIGSFSLIESRCGLFLLHSSCDRGKQSQLLLQQTEVKLGLQVGVEFDKLCTNFSLRPFTSSTGYGMDMKLICNWSIINEKHRLKGVFCE